MNEPGQHHLENKRNDKRPQPQTSPLERFRVHLIRQDM
jgi:hypothetical protein